MSDALVIGFDSAWANNRNAPGAICSVLFDGAGFQDFCPPELVDFEGALEYIRSIQETNRPTLVALDQPTIVPNETGMRPVEKAVASLVSWMGGGVQPANRGLRLFRDDAPIHWFLKKLGATEDPEAARTAVGGLHLMEVFPALALASLDASFFGRGKGPRYNPARRKTFRIEHWKAVVTAAQSEAASFGRSSLAAWLNEQRGKSSPKKSDQDCLDAALCLLIAIRWRIGARELSIAIGDLKNGYIVTPASALVVERLSKAAKARGVPINALGSPIASAADSLERRSQ